MDEYDKHDRTKAGYRPIPGSGPIPFTVEMPGMRDSVIRYFPPAPPETD
jgi:hypothetical protein